MYCISKEFTEKIHTYTNQIEEKSNGVLVFEEYIPLPHFGNTVLRFNICKDTYTLEDLDAYEALMQDIVKDEFLVDFMGSVYQKVGFEPQMFEEKFIKCYHRYKHIPITPRDYQKLLEEDARSLLKICGFPPDVRVWEIQTDEEISLFILGKENRGIGTYRFEEKELHVYEVEETSCVGLMKAILYAKEQRISMVRVLLEA